MLTGSGPDVRKPLHRAEILMNAAFFVFLVVAALTANAGAAVGSSVPSAYTRDDDQICVDVPEGLVDWGALARKKAGNARVDHPSKEFLRKHSDDYGPSLELKVVPTAAVTGRLWNVLHETGVYRLQPEWLRVVVEYQVDENLNLREPTAFAGEVCGRGRPSIHAAFVLPENFQLLGEAKWGIDVSPPVFPCSTVKDCARKSESTYTLLWDGHRYHHKSAGSAFMIKRASVFRREDDKLLILIRWAEGGCEWDFSLFEVSGTELVEVGVNDYGCDV
jgi:hypothetical protein